MLLTTATTVVPAAMPAPMIVEPTPTPPVLATLSVTEAVEVAEALVTAVTVATGAKPGR